jgi:hypothetical protein
MGMRVRMARFEGVGPPVVVRVRMVVSRKDVSMDMHRSRVRLRTSGALQRLVHDLLDRSDAASALRAATEAAVNLARSPGIPTLGTDCAAHVMVAQHIAGTNDHGSELPLR